MFPEPTGMSRIGNAAQCGSPPPACPGSALGIGTGRPPVQVRAGDCYAAGNRSRPVDRDEARRLPASGLPACPPRPHA
ncbi:DUF6233 domain-containing protein [Streptomyces swartbergensis]|uniref:DUF6233 domain-containing protein n=1 Tax=Streptomyces swartbergensis TaxID=487165 RepID=UPI00382786B3